MLCRKCQYLIATEPADVVAADVAVQAHPAACADCAQFTEDMTAVSRALRCLPELQASDGFECAVRVRRGNTQQADTVSWWERLVGPLRAPAPVLQPRQIAVAACLLVLALGLLAYALQPAASPLLPQATPGIVQPAGGQPVSYPKPVPPGEAAPGPDANPAPDQ